MRPIEFAIIIYKEARACSRIYIKFHGAIDEDMNGARASNPKRIILRIWTTLDAYRGITLVSVPRLHGTMRVIRTPRISLARRATAAATPTCELNSTH